MLGNASKADVAVPCLAYKYPVWMHVAPDLVSAELRFYGDLHLTRRAGKFEFVTRLLRGQGACAHAF